VRLAFGYAAAIQMDPKSSQPQAFYRWVDAEGHLHVVSSLDAVPSAQRAKAERITLTGETALGADAPAARSSEWRLEPGSFGLGFGAALALSLLFRLMPNGWRVLSRVALVLGAVVVITGLYLGAIRRATGNTTGSAMASPSALIQDAKAAVEQLNSRQKQQEEELRQLQAEGH